MGFLKRAINNLTIQTPPPPPPQGVAMSRIAAVNITSTTPSVTFSGLNGNSDGLYWFFAYNINLDNAGGILRLQFNNDTSSSDYLTLLTRNDGGTSSTAQISNQLGIVLNDSIFGDYPAFLISASCYIFAGSLATTNALQVIGMCMGVRLIGVFHGTSLQGQWRLSGQTNLTTITFIAGPNFTSGRVELWAPRTV